MCEGIIPLGYWQKVNQTTHGLSTTPFVKALVRWATGKRLTNRLPKLSPIPSAIEKPVSDLVLRLERSSSRCGPPFGAVFDGRASPCSSLSTRTGVASALLASSPCQGCCFCFMVKLLFGSLLTRIYEINIYIV